ncbi:Hsp70 family protein [Dactylosporangium aurantiacum]|uniref:Hsp70 family protein n=1 Tax=Dactylosporangium aurantiacum TaxID=35754 RepID=A0A9Q9I889_9ACTN|nr:Hsp70 family protein [Dactylosporangium aurantiacum]MDG6105022.1 Hsp70 family protein [Dactylosporangium aurantiacum]UWZ51554.1 Hsp70 family protein [Dactylosporangium aurantiacum]
MDEGRLRLGIDVGTSSTVAALMEPSGRVRVLLFDASPLLPSAVHAGAGGTLLVGQDAERAAAGDPAGLEPNPKRRVDDGTVWLGEREVAVPDLLAALLGRVAAEAHRVAGRAPDDVVLTHPATWASVRLGVLAEAARRAGLGTVRFVPEPVAAAAHFAATVPQRIPPGRCLVVYDLGAGTFDVTVLRPHAAGFETLATAGLDDVGGLDLDAAVIAHARGLTAGSGDVWRRLDWPQTPADQRSRQLLWRNAKAAKEHLSRHAAADLHVPLADAQVRLTREELDKLARPHLDRTAALTLSALQDAAVPPEQIGGVYLVGGSSRMPLAATLLHRTLHIAPTVLDHPELVVAEGALHATAASAPGQAGDPHPPAPATSTASMMPPAPTPPPTPTMPQVPSPSTMPQVPAVPRQAPPAGPPVTVPPAVPVSAPAPAAAVTPPGSGRPAAPPPGPPVAPPAAPFAGPPTAPFPGPRAPFAGPPTAPASAAPVSGVPVSPPVPPPASRPASPTGQFPLPGDAGGRRTGATARVVLAAGAVLAVVLVIALRPWNLWSDGDGGGDPGSAGLGGAGTRSATGTPSPGQATDGPLHTDDFNGGSLASSWDVVTGDWKVTGGELVGSYGSTSGWQTVMLAKDLPDDVTVSCRVLMTGKGVAELMLHASGRRYVRVYLYAIDGKVALGDGKLDSKGAADGGGSVKTKSLSVKPDTWYDLEVTVEDGRYTVDVDGDTMVSYTDSTDKLSASGRLGFTANSAAIHVDDLTVVRA